MWMRQGASMMRGLRWLVYAAAAHDKKSSVWPLAISTHALMLHLEQDAGQGAASMVVLARQSDSA